MSPEPEDYDDMEEAYTPEDIAYCPRCDFFNVTQYTQLNSGLLKCTCTECKFVMYLPAHRLKNVPEIYDRVRRIETPITEDEFLGSIGKGWKKHAKGFILDTAL